MKISLAKANKIRNSLDKMTLSTPTVISVRTSDSMESAKKAVEAGMQKIISDLTEYAEVMDFLFELRRKIDTTNKEIGLDGLIFSIVKAATIAKAIHNLAGLKAFNNFKSLKDFEDLLWFEQEQKKADATKVYPITTIAIRVIDDGFQKKIQEMMKKASKDLEAFKEQRNSLNYSTTIELSEKEVELLRRLELL